jgi:hypothetical protein
MRVVYEWTDDGAKKKMNFKDKRTSRVGIFVPIYQGDFSQTDATTRLAKDMTPSGTKSTPYELVGAAKTDSGVWNQDKGAAGTQVLLGSTISG